MNPLTLEWLAKAEADFATARRELRARKCPNYDAVCFHAQQCAEKMLKGALCENGVYFSKSHDLVRLLELLASKYPHLELLRPLCSDLTAFAVEFRYPGENATKEVARLAAKNAETIRQQLLQHFPF
jgi:HEPN domain-containing protein